MKLMLKDLILGDRFIHATARNKKNAHVWKVVADSVFSLSDGCEIRKCHNMTNGTVARKPCSLLVEKTERVL